MSAGFRCDHCGVGPFPGRFEPFAEAWLPPRGWHTIPLDDMGIIGCTRDHAIQALNDMSPNAPTPMSDMGQGIPLPRPDPPKPKEGPP